MNIKTRTQTIIKNNKSQFLFCLITTFILGLIAHGFMFFNNSISHDSLNQFISNDDFFKCRIQYGRFFCPVYQFLTRGFITVPWLIGVLSLLYISIAVFFVVKIFYIQSKPITILISGIFTVNLTIISLTATYIHDMDTDVFAMLLAVISVFSWQKYKFGYLFGIIPLILTLGLYQSYISIAITLILFVLILKLLNGAEFKQVFSSGLKAVCMLLCSGVLYFILMKLTLHFSNLSIISGEYNSIDAILNLSFIEIVKAMFFAYYRAVAIIIKPISSFPKVLSVIFGTLAVFLSSIPILKYLFDKKSKLSEKLLAIILLGLIPFAMNISEILTGGMSHYLMYFSLWLTYLFVVLLADFEKRNSSLSPKKTTEYIYKTKKAICLCFVALIIFGNIRLANTAYVVKNFDKDATLSLFTRITAEIENYENYIPGETKVVFVGRPDSYFNDSEEFKNVRSLTGMENPCVIGSYLRTYYYSYYKHILKTPISLVHPKDWDTFCEGNATVEEMPVYPQDGCMKMIDGVLVVKLGDNTIMDEF